MTAVTPPKLRMLKKDRMVFSALYEFGVLTCKEIAQLTGWHGEHTRRRVRQLVAARYIVEVITDDRTNDGYLNRAKTYSLANRGASAIGVRKRQLGKRQQTIDFTYNAKRRTSDQCREHDLIAAKLIMQARSSLSPAVGYISDEKRLTRVKDWLFVDVRYDGESYKVRLKPDGYFIVPTDQGDRYYALEYSHRDMQMSARTLSRSSMLKKLLGYDALITQGLLEEQIGVKNVTVLFVENKPERVKKMVELAQSLDLRNPGQFLFVDRSAFEQFSISIPIFHVADASLCRTLSP